MMDSNMFTSAEALFIERLAATRGLDLDYVMGTLQRDSAFRDGRLVSVRLVQYPLDELDLTGLDALENIYITGAVKVCRLGQLPHLKVLNLADTRIETLDLSGCPQLTNLKVSRTKLRALPPLPQSMTVLDVSGCELGELPLLPPKLVTLGAAACQITNLSLLDLPDLTWIDIAFNPLSVVDLSAQRFLEVLWCQGMGARLKLPSEAPLKKLVISDNPLQYFDASAFSALETLFVNNMGLEELILDNPKLEHLDCGGNALKTLPTVKIPRLRILKAETNPMKALDITMLSRLSELKVDSATEVICTEFQRHRILTLRQRFGLPKPTSTIKKMDQFQLHAFVEDYNWDDGHARLFEVIRHPKCSLATALLVYWNSEPQDFSGFHTPEDASRSDRKWVQLLREIEAGVSTARFAAGPIPFNVGDVGGVDLSNTDPLIPDFMRLPVQAISGA